LVVFGSNLISKLMSRYKIIVFIGAAILGKVGGEMILTDEFVSRHLMPRWGALVGAQDTLQAYTWLRYGVEIALVLFIFFYGWSRRRRQEPVATLPDGPV
jgi:predicted tellurium resistance membrane protein TerC